MSEGHLRVRPTPVILWPLKLAWKLVTFIANLTGIVLALIIGALLMIVGLALISTIAGAIVGIPLFIIGFLLVLRALY